MLQKGRKLDSKLTIVVLEICLHPPSCWATVVVSSDVAGALLSEFFKIFFLEAHLLLPPSRVTSGRVPIPPGPSQCPILKLYSKFIPTSRFMAWSATYYLHNYKLNILLTYFNVLFLTICTILCGVALLPVSVASSCPRTSGAIPDRWDVIQYKHYQSLPQMGSLISKWRR